MCEQIRSISLFYSTYITWDKCCKTSCINKSALVVKALVIKIAITGADISIFKVPQMFSAILFSERFSKREFSRHFTNLTYIVVLK